MTAISWALLALDVLLVLALYREHANHLHHTTLLLERAETERASLLDRIQHPQVRQVEPQRFVPPDPPKDAAEFAQVGMEVPEFVHVGDPTANNGDSASEPPVSTGPFG